MKKLFTFILLLWVVASAHAASSVITATIIVTNTPADGDSITVNGSARTWKNTVATASSQILIGASIGANATNMFNQFAATPFTTLTLNRSGTNGVTLRGVINQAMVLSISGTWGYYTLATNTPGTWYPVMTPAAGYTVQSSGTNDYSNVALDLGTYSTNRLAADTTLVFNLVQTSGDQTVSGIKSFDEIDILDGTAILSEATIEDLYAENIYATGPLWMANADPSLFFYDSNGAADNKAIEMTMYHGDLSIDVISDDGGTVNPAIQINRTGTTVDTVDIVNGKLVAQDGFENQTKTIFIQSTHTALANGNNANIAFGDSTYVKVKAGPSAAFALCGIVTNGLYYIVHNDTGQNMTVANESGVEATPAERILTGTGGDIATTGNGVVTLIYDTDASRWQVVSIRD